MNNQQQEPTTLRQAQKTPKKHPHQSCDIWTHLTKQQQQQVLNQLEWACQYLAQRKQREVDNDGR